MCSTTAAIRNGRNDGIWTSQVLRVRCPQGTFASRIAITCGLAGPRCLPTATSALETELRSEKMALSMGLAPSAFPQTTGRSAN